MFVKIHDGLIGWSRGSRLLRLAQLPLMPWSESAAPRSFGIAEFTGVITS
jgi:hypothetical protein